MVRVSFHRFDGLNTTEALRFGGHLADAARSNPQLSRELPLVAAGYHGKPRAALRLGRVARSSARHQLSPYVMTDRDRAIGVVTAQKHRPHPDLLDETDPPADAFELSYWHRYYDSETAKNIGVQAVRYISARLKPDPYGTERLWMVTLPEDDVKSGVMRELHFTAEAQAVFAIGDEVTVPRTLWSRA